MRRPSLRRRLLWLVGLPVIALWLAAGAWLAQRTAHETAEMFDRELQRTAASVLALVALLPDRASKIERSKRHHGSEDQHPEIIVRDRTGRLLLDASTLPALPITGEDPHFRSVRQDGESWRVYQRWDAGQRYWIQVAAPLHDREELLVAHVGALLAPLAGLLLLLPLAIWLGLRGGLAPLRKVSRAIAAQPARTPTLSRDDVPAELLQLTRALDELVANLDRALSRERRFTADAAHELRHPLATLRLELDLAGRSDDAAARNSHLERAQHALDRMQRLVTQLLLLARVEKLSELGDAGPLHLVSVAESVLREASERAAARDIELALDHAGDDRVSGSRGLLEILTQNLLDNALRHAPKNGQVNMRVRGEADRVTIEVNDSGSGFPTTDPERLGERFHRPEGSLGEGSGLGLSIVQAIARLHHGQLQFGRSELGGAQVRFSLPCAAPATRHAGDA